VRERPKEGAGKSQVSYSSCFRHTIAMCRYLVSVYDRTSGFVTIFPTAKTPHILTQTVKKLKSIPPAPDPTPSAYEYKKARTLLGETFGTKKAKAAIRARERNRIDVGAMEGVMDFVMEGIEKATSGMPTKGICCASIQCIYI
jgi:DNA-directed RNA polymerase I subunit RPA49